MSAAAGPARAQEIPDTGGRVFGLVGGVFGDGDTTVLTSAGAGLRITRHLGLDLEVLYAPDLGLPNALDFVIQTVGAEFAPVERVERSRMVSFLTKMTVEFPVANGRVWPYLTGGGGVGSLRQSVAFRNVPLPLRLNIFPGPEIVTSATDLALTVGGGVDVRLWRGFAVGTDIRYLRLLDDTGFDFAFVTSRVSYRF
jgi:opacity protein-like surface antigen